MMESRIKLGMSGNPSERMKARREGSVRIADAVRLLAAVPFIGFSAGR
jgi:hypothetical protein